MLQERDARFTVARGVRFADPDDAARHWLTMAAGWDHRNPLARFELHAGTDSRSQLGKVNGKGALSNLIAVGIDHKGKWF